MKINNLIKGFITMLEYFKRLFKKWYAYLAILPGLIDNIQSHLDYTIPISSNILNGFALIALFYATYQVWNDMRLEKLELEEKLKNPIDYEIKASIKKVKVDLDYIEKSIDENIEESGSLINSAIEELEKLSYDDIDPRVQMVKEAMRTSNSWDNGHNQSEAIYKIDWRNYIEKLKSYSDKKNNYLLEWKSFIENELKDIYIVDFYITNTGSQFDENIDIEIHFNKENKYIGRIRLLDNFPSSFNLPSKPERQRMDNFFRSQSLHNDFDIHKMDILQMDSNPLTYKRYEKIEEHIFSIKLRDLKVSETVKIFRQDSFYINIDDRNNIDVVISSKNSTKRINKKLIFEDNGNFDYFNI